MITNVSSISFKRMYPEDYAEITGKSPDYSFYPKDNKGNIVTDYYDDCIEKYKRARTSHTEISSKAPKKIAVKPSFIQKIRKMLKIK